jgi:hypothetical protein
MIISRKAVLAGVCISLFVFGIASACSLATWFNLKPSKGVPRGYITLWQGDMMVTSTELSPPDPSQACTVVIVNHSAKSVESVLLKFSTDTESTFADDPGGFGSTVGEFRASQPLIPGARMECLKLASPGTLESVAVGWGDQAKTHAVAAPLAAGKKLVISYEPDGTIATRTE